MPLENAPYVGNLNPANPAGADDMVQGDDHIRVTKGALVNTFPNLTAPVTATAAQLNAAAAFNPATKQDAATAINISNIGSQSVAYAASAGAVAWTSVSGRPTAVSAFSNDSGYVTSAGSVNYAASAGSVAWGNVSGRPTAVSSFTNDSGYVTGSGSVNYATSAGSAGSVSGGSSNGFGTRTVSTGTPSGGSDGDLWYQV